MNSQEEIFFISFGGPEKPDEVMPFLEHVTQGRGIPSERLLGVAEHYMHFGGRSPIAEITRRQARALEELLRKKGDARRVRVGQRHSAPFIEDALRRMKDEGVTRAFGLCTAAYRCEASHERYIAAVEKARANIGPDAPVVEYARPWFEHPLFSEAIAARIREKSFPNESPWTFTAHSIPCSMAKASRYVEELRAVAGRVADKFGKKDWTLAYTSRSGSPRDAWLEPDVSKVITGAATRGARDMVVIPIGFLADHVEVLYDLDVEAHETAQKAGIRLHRVETVGDHPLFIEMLADVVRRGAPTDPAAESVSTRRDAPPSCYCFPNDPESPCRRVPTARPTRP